MDQLGRLIDEHGLRVVERSGPTWGGFDPRTRTIRVSPGMSARATRSVLAHELAHAVLGHVPAPHGALQRVRQEQRADEWAARLLISPAAYAEAEATRGPHPASLAFELGVTVELVYAFQRLLRRRAA
jgi:Zn-dependent peptidase ImmA (M78 family)